MLVVVSPGQGAQRPGMLTPWLELPGVRGAVAAASDVCGLDLLAAGTTGTAEQIADTAVAQPLLTTTALVTAGLLPNGPFDAVVAGHSVGELSAAVLAGVLDQDDALRLVAARGRAMAAASAASHGGMTAVLGGDPDEVVAAIEAAGAVAANVNGAGQVVAAGPVEAMARLADAPPPGARLRALSVAGAFHTEAMAPATERMREVARDLVPHQPFRRLLGNADGQVVTDPADVVERLIAQVTLPVRWDLCQQTMDALGVTGLLELAPGGTLAGIARRTLPHAEIVALKGPDDLSAAVDLVERHSVQPGDSTFPVRLLVSPSKGTLSRSADERSSIASGDPVAAVLTRAGEVAVVAAYDAHVVEWLAADGDPVAEGQPLARLAAEEVSA